MSAATLDPNTMNAFLSFLGPRTNPAAMPMAPTTAGMNAPPAVPTASAAPTATNGEKGIDWGTLAPIFVQLIQSASGKGFTAPPPAKDFSPTGKDFWDVFNNVAPIVLQTIQAVTKGEQPVPQPTKGFSKDFLNDLGSFLPVIINTVQALSKGETVDQTPLSPDSKGFWDTFRQVVQTAGQVVQVAGPIIAAVA